MKVFRTTSFLLAIVTMLASSIAVADVADFEDVPAGKIPATPFVSGGLLFESIGIADAVFPSDILLGADNGTQVFAWCGSNCTNGEAQIITVSSTQSDLFDLTAIDVGNLLPAGFGPGEWVPGMTVDLTGFLSNGDKITQELAVQENMFTTYKLEDFLGLERLEITAPPVLLEGTSGNPDPVIDNLVWNPTTAIPEPGSAAVASILLLGCCFRRRR